MSKSLKKGPFSSHQRAQKAPMNRSTWVEGGDSSYLVMQPLKQARIWHQRKKS